MLKNRKLSMVLAVAFSLGLLSGLAPSLEASSQAGCLHGYECVVDAGGDSCEPAWPWDGCKMIIETCTGC